MRACHTSIYPFIPFQPTTHKMNLDIDPTIDLNSLAPFKATCSDSLAPIATIQPSVLLPTSTTPSETTIAPSVLCRLPGCTCMGEDQKKGKQKSTKMTRSTRSHVRTRKNPSSAAAENVVDTAAAGVSLSWPDTAVKAKATTGKGKKTSNTLNSNKVKSRDKKEPPVVKVEQVVPEPAKKQQRRKRAKTIAEPVQPGALIWPEAVPAVAATSCSVATPRKKIKVEKSVDAQSVSTTTGSAAAATVASQDGKVDSVAAVTATTKASPLVPPGPMVSLPHRCAPSNSSSYALELSGPNPLRPLTRAHTAPTNLPSYSYHQHNLFYYDAARAGQNRYPTSHMRSSSSCSDGAAEQHQPTLVVLPRLIANLPPPPGPKRMAIEPRPWRPRADSGWPWWDVGALAP